MIRALRARGIVYRYLAKSELGQINWPLVSFCANGTKYASDGATFYVSGNSPAPGRVIGDPPLLLLKHKDLVDAVLRAGGLRCPITVTLPKEATEEAKQIFHTLRPSAPLGLCVKPVDGKFGKSVHIGLTELEAFVSAFRRVARKRGRALIQETVPGTVYRFFVLDGRCIAIRYASFPFVVGDGKNSIEKLVMANQINPVVLTSGTTRRMLRDRGMNKDFVPVEGENIVLGNTTNLHQGVCPVDATDDVHPSYIALVERAVALFPGLIMAGVDIAIENASVPAGENYHFIEVNCGPGYAAHHNPSKGKPRDVAGAIVDYLMGRRVGAI